MIRPMYLDKNPLVAMHVRHDSTQLLEVCFIPLNNAFQREKMTPLHMRLIPFHDPRGQHGIHALQYRKVDGSFLYRKWGGVDQVEARTLFENWVTGVLRLEGIKKIIPVCHGWYRYAHLMRDWLGCSFDDLLSTAVRDINVIHAFFLDRTNAWGIGSNNSLNFGQCLKYFSVNCLDTNSMPMVAVAIGEMYRAAIFKSMA